MSLVIPDEIVQSTRMTVAELLREFALTLFQLEKLTLGQASKLAGVSQWQFQQLLGYQELSAAGGQHPGAIVQQLDWVEPKTVSDQMLVNALLVELDKGETEAIAAHELARSLC